MKESLDGVVVNQFLANGICLSIFVWIESSADVSVLNVQEI